MRIDNISLENFKGKALYTNRLGEKEKQFAKDILNYKIDGISNKKYLAAKDFDIELNSFNTRKTVHPKIRIYSRIKFIMKYGRFKGQENSDYKAFDVRMDEGVENGAKVLRKCLDDMEEYFEKKYDTRYYGIWQRIITEYKVKHGKV